MQSFENFLVLCEELNYTKAAKRLGISQPSLSAYIKRLENFFGTKLFSKNGSSLVLTTQGGWFKILLRRSCNYMPILNLF